MTTYYVDSEDIISDFLRANLTDPRARAEASESQSDTATAGQTEITLTPTSGSVSSITSLTVNGTTKKKWLDYYWDYQNQKITFFTALTLADAVVTTYKYGTSNWIYSDRPDQAISATSFPRISVFTVSAPGTRLGQYDAPVEGRPRIQIDIWTRNDDFSYTVDGRTYTRDYLARYLGHQITKAFEDSEEDLFPVLYNYTVGSGPRAAPYSEEYTAYHSIVEIILKGLRLGRIEV